MHFLTAHFSKTDDALVLRLTGFFFFEATDTVKEEK